MSQEEILDAISALTVIELKELLDAFEEKFDVTAAAPVAVAAAAPAGGGAGGEDDQTEFDVILNGVGLKDAKDLVDGAPKPLMEKVAKADADAAKAKLEEVGADVEVK